MKLRLEYNTEWEKWALALNSDTHKVTFPVAATIPERGALLDPSTPAIELELPAAISIDFNFARMMGGGLFTDAPLVRSDLPPVKIEEQP